MNNFQQSYRIFKATVDFVDYNTNQVITTEAVLDMGDVTSFEKYPYDSLNKFGEHVTLFFGNNRPPVTVRYKFKDFFDLYEKYLLDIRALDARSQKKTLNYIGDMKSVNMSGPQYFVTTFYPRNFDFKGKTESEVMDSILLNEIRPLS
jgi:hypothetical protein